MAKKKKRYSPKRRAHRAASSPRRRRRVGAMALNANSMIVKLGSVALGYVMGEKILAPVKSMIGDKVDGKIVAGAEGLAGYYLAFKKGGKKGMIQTVAGGILLGDAVKTLMKSFGMGGFGPYGRIPALGNRSPYGRIPALGSYNPHGTLNGSYNPHGTLSNRMMAGIGMV